MSTAIENLLFRSYGTHGVKSISFGGADLTLVVAPWSALDNELEAHFSHARLRYIQSENEGDGVLDFPWDIIAIDCVAMDEQHWEFCLRCSAIEIVFRARWPEIMALKS